MSSGRLGGYLAAPTLGSGPDELFRLVSGRLRNCITEANPNSPKMRIKSVSRGLGLELGHIDNNPITALRVTILGCRPDPDGPREQSAHRRNSSQLRASRNLFAAPEATTRTQYGDRLPPRRQRLADTDPIHPLQASCDPRLIGAGKSGFRGCRRRFLPSCA